MGKARSIEVTITSLHKEPLAKAASRILVSKDNMIALTGSLEDGRLCEVERADGTSAPLAARTRRQACLWVSPEPLKKNLAYMSLALREACGFRASEKIRITSSAESIPDSAETVVREVPRSNAAPLPGIEAAQIPGWIAQIEERLDAAEVVFPGMVIRDVLWRRVRRDFVVELVDGCSDNLARFLVDQTRVRLLGGEMAAIAPTEAAAAAAAAEAASTADKLEMTLALRPQSNKLRVEPMAGLESTVACLNKKLSIFRTDHKVPAGMSCAVVLQGDKGTGKTMLLQKLAGTGWGSVHAIHASDKMAAIQETLQRATLQRPSIVTIDNLHKLLYEDRPGRVTLIKLLCDLLDQHAWPGKTGENGENGRPRNWPQLVVVATCLDYKRDIPEELQDRRRLCHVVTIPFPDTTTRQAIFRSLDLDLPPEGSEQMIRDLSLKTHAFNGTELCLLAETAAVERSYRLEQAETNESTADPDLQSPYLTRRDFEAARLEIAPKRMDGVNIKPLPVYWQQIQGQETLVRGLQEAVKMLNEPEKYRPFMKYIPRGYLLYGPPGCSKTMAAQALATESGLNYFSIKGGELLNQYVGESERGVRDLFERARRAAPAVIFLDEIDAIAGRRSDSFGSSSSSSGRGPQVVPALLSELDGFQSLDKVIVVAATNRPETVDPALLRPGRLENHFYVPPPNEAARRAMLSDWVFGMRVSAGLDIDHLARLTEGFSGAEVLGVCQRVGAKAARANAEDGAAEMTTTLFEEEIHKTPRTITEEMVNFFRKWVVSY